MTVKMFVAKLLKKYIASAIFISFPTGIPLNQSAFMQPGTGIHINNHVHNVKANACLSSGCFSFSAVH